MAKSTLKFDKPTCGHCGRLSRPAGNASSRWRVCERGHKLYKK